MSATRSPIPASTTPGADEKALVVLSDILPTSFQRGVLNGKVQPVAALLKLQSALTVACGDGIMLRRRGL
jgi:hypothetical protein